VAGGTVGTVGPAGSLHAHYRAIIVMEDDSGF
jgi:hypothetical protein